MTERAAGTLIGTGRNADVFDAGGGKVLRRYRDGRPPEWVRREAEVMTHARAHGVPVPEVFEVDGGDIVMERAAGPTMIDVLARRPWTLHAQARLLARLHEQVHAVPPLPWLPAPFEAAAGTGASARVTLLHRDLHPLNVILTRRGPRLIDWEGAAQGPPDADIGMTWVIIAFSEVPGSPVRVMLGRLLQGALGRSFLAAAHMADAGWLSEAVTQRLRDPNLLPSERARLVKAHQTATRAL